MDVLERTMRASRRTARMGCCGNQNFCAQGEVPLVRWSTQVPNEGLNVSTEFGNKKETAVFGYERVQRSVERAKLRSIQGENGR